MSMSNFIAGLILAATMVFSPLATSSFADDKPTPETQEVQEVEQNKNVFVSELPNKDEVAPYLQDISVTIVSGRGEGSGVVKSKRDENGNVVNFVWTAAHVIDDLRRVRTVIDPKTGTGRQIVEFQDAWVVKDIKQNGRSVGQLKLAAEVVRYSDADTGHDLALLRIRQHGFIESSAVFYECEGNEKTIPPIGTSLFHVGSLLGQMGSNSMTTGIVSQHGRLISGNKKVFDQTTCPGFPGSSGGGVYTTDGRYVGMLVRGAGETFNLIVPVRRMAEWAEKANVKWAMTDEAMPTYAELEKLPIEDVGKSWNPAYHNKGENEAEDEGHAASVEGLDGVKVRFRFGYYKKEKAIKE